jgi:hypothetical protein
VFKTESQVNDAKQQVESNQKNKRNRSAKNDGKVNAAEQWGKETEKWAA